MSWMKVIKDALGAGKEISRISKENALLAGKVIKVAAKEGVKETVDTFKETSATALGSFSVSFLSSLNDIRNVSKDPAYTTPEKLFLGSTYGIYAGAGIFGFITTFTAFAALGPIAAIVQSGTGLIKSAANAYGAVKKDQRYNKELNVVEKNISNLNHQITFLKKNELSITNLLSVIDNVRTDILKLKDLGEGYEKLPEHFKEDLDKLNSLQKNCAETNKAYKAYLKLARDFGVVLSKDPIETNSLDQKLKDLETWHNNFKDNSSLKKETKENLEKQYSLLKEKIEQAKTVLDPSNPKENLQQIKKQLVSLINGAKTQRNDELVKLSNTDAMPLLEGMRTKQELIRGAVKDKIKNNKRDFWQNIGKAFVSAAVVGLAVGSLFFPPLAIAVTSVGLASSIVFLGVTAYKKYQAHQSKKALQKELQDKLPGKQAPKDEPDVDKILTNAQKAEQEVAANAKQEIVANAEHGVVTKSGPEVIANVAQEVAAERDMVAEFATFMKEGAPPPSIEPLTPMDGAISSPTPQYKRKQDELRQEHLPQQEPISPISPESEPEPARRRSSVPK